MSRAVADASKIERLMAELGREARGPGAVFFFDEAALRAAFELLRPALLRYPAIDEEVFAAKLDEFLAQTTKAGGS